MSDDKMMKAYLKMLLLLLLFGMNGAYGATWYVSQTGNDGNDGLSWGTALANPQTAIDRASAGDSVLIGEGRYHATHIVETASEAIYTSSFVLKEGVSLHGGYLPGQSRRTKGEYAWSFGGRSILTLPEGQTGSVLVNAAPFTTETVLDGLVLEGGIAVGSGDAGLGGGARLSGAVLMQSCVIQGNIAGNGGGVYLGDGARMRNCLVKDNHVMDEGWGGNGGGIYATGDTSVANCLITGNGSGVRRGGGVYTAGAARIEFCTITANEAIREGSGLHLTGGRGSVSGTVIWGNCGGTLQASIDGTALHCAIEGQCPNDSCVPLQKSNAGAHGNAYNDNWVGGYFPCFASPEEDDWRLGAGSYLINRGGAHSLDSDGAGNPRCLCGAADIGAFEAPHRGNLALDFEMELPCIYGNTCSVTAVPGALTPQDINVTFQDVSRMGTWRNDGEAWSVRWQSAGAAFPSLMATPACASDWNALSLQRELQVSRRPIYISADDKEYTYLEEMPHLTWRIVAGSLAEGDAIDGALQCEANADLETAWLITRGSLSIDDGANGTNYLLTFLNGEMLCHKAEPEISFSARSGTYNGECHALELDTIPPGLAYTCEYRDANGALLDAPPSNAGTYSATITIQDAHYSGTFTAQLNIEKATLTAKALDSSRQYQEPNGAFTVNVTGLLGNDSINDIEMPTASSGADYAAPAGEYPIVVSGGSARNYNFQYVNGVLTVTKADVSATVEDSAMVFGAMTDEAPIVGQAFHAGNGNPVSGTFQWLEGERQLDAGDNEVAWLFIPDNERNYNGSSGTAIIHVARQALKIKANDIEILYGEEEGELTYSITSGTRGLAADGALAREAGNGVGTYKIMLGSLDFGPNYIIDFTEGDYKILPREIKVRMLDMQKEYGEADPALQYEIVDGMLVGNSRFTGAPQREAGEAIGQYEIGAGDLSISDAQNYSMSTVPGTFSILRSTKPGMVDTLEVGEIRYGDMLGDISISGTMLSADGTHEMPGVFQWRHPDTYPNAGLQTLEWTFTPHDLMTASPFSGTVEVEVDKAVLDVQITGGAAARYYKDPNPEYELVYSGFIGDDDESCIRVSPQIDTLADYETLPGTYLVGIKGGEADNYTFQATPIRLNVLGRKVASSDASEMEATTLTYGDRLEMSDVSGYIIDENTGDIITGTFLWKAGDCNPLPGVSMQQCIFIPASTCYTGSVVTVPIVVEKCRLSISSLPASKNYGEDDPELQWICIDDKSSLIPKEGLALEIGRQEGEDAGDYETCLAYCEENPLFDIDYVPGIFTIRPLPLHVTANDTFKFYLAEDPVFNCTVTGTMPDGVFIDGSPSREEGEEIGTYRIGMGSLSLSSPNYSIVLTEGTFTIYKRPLYISLVNSWKYYDKQPETLEYTVTNTLPGSNVTLVGTLGRKEGENVGSYLVDTSALQPTDPEHFCVASNNVWFQIKPREVKIQFDDQEGMYLEPNPTFTFKVVEGSVLEGDSFSGGGASSNSVGSNSISLGTLTLGGNYKLSCIPGTFTIYTDVPYLVFEGFERELYAYESLNGVGFSAKAYRVHSNAEVEGTFSILPANKTCNAGTETVTLKFEYRRRKSYASTSYITSSVTQTIAFNVNKLRINIRTGDYTRTYGDEWPEIKYELVSCCSDKVASPLKLLTGNFLSFDAGDDDIGTFPILYSPENMTNSNVELAVQAGTISVSPRRLLVEARSMHALNTGDFDAEALPLDYEVISVLNTKSKDVDLEAEKGNAPQLKLACNAGAEAGAHKITFREYNATNYDDYSNCYEFMFADGIFLLFDSEDRQSAYENEHTRRNNIASQYNYNATFDVVFVTTDATGKGDNYFESYDAAYSKLNGGGIICFEPGSHPSGGSASIKLNKPMMMLGISDENGNMPTINGRVTIEGKALHCTIENLRINSTSADAIYVPYSNSNLHVRDCDLISGSHAISRIDKSAIAENCTYSAAKLYSNE